MLKRYIKNSALRILIEWFLAIAIAFVLFILVDSFLLKSSRIDGASMEPFYFHNDRVIVNRMAFLFREPYYGDVIVFPFDGDTTRHYIKRIAGLPGDTIDFRNGFIYVNGIVLGGYYPQAPVFIGNVSFPFVLDDDYFFVLGDNREISLDSRFVEVGNVHRDDIMGRIIFRWFPFERFGTVN